MAEPRPASSSTPPLVSNFPSFSNLATELRLKIWSHAFNQCPRTISVRYLPTRNVCVSSARPPIFLSVNREARYEALRVYKLFFATPSAPAQIHFNPTIDTLYLPRYRDMGYDETLRDFRRFLKKGEELDEVGWLALDFVEGEKKRPWESYDKAVLIKSFANLQNIFLVIGDSLCKEGRKKLGALDESVEFVVPRHAPLEVERIGIEFKDAFEREQSFMKNITERGGLGYTVWDLPKVVVVAKRRERCSYCRRYPGVTTTAPSRG